MVDYRLDKAHPEYQQIIPTTFDRLIARYPFATLKRVELIDPISKTDTSMGAALPGGVVQLNAYWFAGVPDRLNDAAKRDTLVPIGDRKIRWHGPMMDEPAQVLSHEFGHIIEQAAPEIIGMWAAKQWQAATEQPVLAPTGYSLANAAEYWAEAFAMFDLGFASEAQANAVKALLSGV